MSEAWIDKFIKASLCVFILLIILIFIIIFLSLYFIVIETCSIICIVISTFPPDLHAFISGVLPLIEAILFDVVLFILAIGIAQMIVKPILSNKHENSGASSDQRIDVDDLVQNFARYISPPFLTTMASILTVFILEIVAELYYECCHDAPIDETLFLCRIALIIGISIAIVAIGVLIKTEHGLTTQPKDSAQHNNPENQ